MIEYLNSIAVASVPLLIIMAALLSADNLKKITDVIDPLKNILNFLGYLPRWIHFNNTLTANVQVLQDKRDKLQHRLNDLRMEIEYEEIQVGRRRKSEVNNWLNSAVTQCTEVQMLLNKTSSGNNCVWKFLYRAWLGNLVAIKIQEVDDLYSVGGFEEVLSCVREKVELLAIKLVGEAARQNISKILTWLGNGVTKIGVHGVRGIGKTAVMMHIHNQLLRKDGVHVYMIQVSDDHKEYDLQGEIAKAVGIELQEEDGPRRAALLHRALGKKNFVLILDGLTKYLLEDRVGIPLDATRGKMIITSRSRDVCRKSGCQNNMIEMDPLSDEEALQMFKHIVELEIKPPIENVATQIVSLCEGVPLKIVGKATNLRGEEDIRVWEKNLK